MARTCWWSGCPITQNVTATRLPSQPPQSCTYFSEIQLLNISGSCVYIRNQHTLSFPNGNICSRFQYLTSTGTFLQSSWMNLEGQTPIIGVHDDDVIACQTTNWFVFRAEDGDIMFLRNVGIYLRVHTASQQPRRPTSSLSPPLESQISHTSREDLKRPRTRHTHC
jgi:hypothetical protein